MYLLLLHIALASFYLACACVVAYVIDVDLTDAVASMALSVAAWNQLKQATATKATEAA